MQNDALIDAGEDDAHHLMNVLVDLSLLASAFLTDKALLWTFDKRLGQVAKELNKDYRPQLQS
ncbi:MAG: hypothetical protein WBJ19_03475 [Rhodoferax sp.]